MYSCLLPFLQYNLRVWGQGKQNQPSALSLLGPRGPSSVSCPASSPLQPRMGHAEPRLTYCASPSLSAQQEQQCFPNPGCTVKSSAHEHLHPIIPHTRSAVVHSAATRHRGHCCKRKVAVISKIFLQPAFSLL